MAQEKTLDEEQGTATQPELELSSRDEAHKAETLRYELDLIPVEEFARAIAVAEQTLATWRSAGEGPSFTKLGKTVFYRRADIKVWVDRCRTELPANHDKKAA